MLSAIGSPSPVAVLLRLLSDVDGIQARSLDSSLCLSALAFRLWLGILPWLAALLSSNDDGQANVSTAEGDALEGEVASITEESVADLSIVGLDASLDEGDPGEPAKE